jgi:hypothetical protein
MVPHERFHGRAESITGSRELRIASERSLISRWLIRIALNTLSPAQIHEAPRRIWVRAERGRGEFDQ